MKTIMAMGRKGLMVERETLGRTVVYRVMQRGTVVHRASDMDAACKVMKEKERGK